MSVRLHSIVLACAALTGCASIMNEFNAPMRFETFDAVGIEIRDVHCTLENDYGQRSILTPVTVKVRRSSKDLQITCVKPDAADGHGVAVSRANEGMAANFLFGSSLGALIDHNNGTAYTYPQWIQVVMGRMLTFDRRADVEGQPNRGVQFIEPVASK